jgi:REP element-mobilizing transposase RayT
MTQNEMKYGLRNSRLLMNEVYFWTDTIKEWDRLLEEDAYKNIIIDCWRNLITRSKIQIYGFVIMPNHIHVVWEMIDKNGKEMPHASFNKFTSHQFLEKIRATNNKNLSKFKETDSERNHRFWQRDPLAIQLNSKSKAEQKIKYIHLNPLQEHWNLANKPEDYVWSSAKFYETGHDEFQILTDYRERF